MNRNYLFNFGRSQIDVFIYQVLGLLKSRVLLADLVNIDISIRSFDFTRSVLFLALGLRLSACLFVCSESNPKLLDPLSFLILSSTVLLNYSELLPAC